MNNSQKCTLSLVAQNIRQKIFIYIFCFLDKAYLSYLSRFLHLIFFIIFPQIFLSSCLFETWYNMAFLSTGCVNSICYTLNAYSAIKNALLSNKNGICTFLRCGHLTYDPWVWLKITSLSSTASVLNDGRISLDIPSFCSEIFFFKTSKKSHSSH